MSSRVSFSRVAALVLLAMMALIASPVAAQPRGLGLEMYTLEGSEEDIAEAAQGLELAGTERTPSGIRTDAVLTPGQRAKLVAAGVRVTVKRNNRGQSVSEQAAAQKAAGFNVFRSW